MDSLKSLFPAESRSRHHTPKCVTLFVGATAATIPSVSLANVGIPMLIVLWPLQWLSLIVVVAVESWLVARTIGVPLATVVKQVGFANLISTLIGVPIAWVVMFAIQVVTGITLWKLTGDSASGPLGLVLNAAWVGDNKTEVRVAVVVLSIAFCTASILIERWWLSRKMAEIDQRALRCGVLLANVTSYVILAALTIGLFSIE